MSKNNIDLVKYCKLQLGKPYWYGTYGQTSSKNLYYAKKRQYPVQYQWSIPSEQLNKRVHDCVGLIKGYLWSDTPDSKPKYNAKQDVSANGMYDRCKVRGKINTLPEVVGVLVFRDGHVGVYIGDGEVIEARGHKYGVVKTKLKNRDFTKWGYCPYIEYVKKEVKYYPKFTGLTLSIVDALKAVGEKDTSLKHRKVIAEKNGINFYSGTPTQNLKLLKLLKNGNLIKA